MAYSVSEVVTLGIGTPSDIPSFITLGLDTGAAPPPPTGGSNLTWKYHHDYVVVMFGGLLKWLLQSS